MLKKGGLHAPFFVLDSINLDGGDVGCRRFLQPSAAVKEFCLYFFDFAMKFKLACNVL
jgi:hypothetical protein